GAGDELAAFRHAGILRRPTGGLQRVVENVDPDHASGAPLSHLDRLVANATAEVGDDGPGNLSPDALTEQDLELAPASVRAAVAVSFPGSTIAQTTEKVVSQRPADQ